MRKTRARRRYEDQLRRERMARRRERPALGVSVQEDPPQPWNVTLPLEVPETVRKMIRDSFLAAAKRLRLELEVGAKVTDVGITVSFDGIVAGSPDAAKGKAVYWCRRIAKAGRIMWTGRGVEDVEVRPA